MRATRKTFHVIYLLSFLLALAWALPAYVQSSYLEGFVAVQAIAWYLSLATLATVVVVFHYPRLIRRFSNYRVMLVVLIANIINLVLLGLARGPWTLLLFFVGYYVTGTLLSINVDVFLEDISDDAHTGRIRTNLLTVANVGWVLAPLLMGWLASGDRYRLVFLAAAIVLVPAILLLRLQATTMRDRFRYRSRHLHELLEVVAGNRNLVKIFSLALALRFFYFIMVVYVPLHLHGNLGFGWNEIGRILTVMLLPFLFLQIPAGRLADRSLGEKEILIVGLITMIVFTGLIFFLRTENPLAWAGVLFMTRVGAALVEAMQEVYFFKLVDRRDVDLINVFRDLGPAGWLAGSLFALVVLTFLPLPYLFLLLAAILTAALKPALTLQDTK